MARPGLAVNVKFRKAVRLLGEPRPHVRGYLEMLWETAYENGEPIIGDADAVEAAAEYPGEPGKLFDALMHCGGDGRAGFIEESSESPGQYQVHDLFDHAPDYVRKRRTRELERKDKGRRLNPSSPGGADKRRTTAPLSVLPHPHPHPRRTLLVRSCASTRRT